MLGCGGGKEGEANSGTLVQTADTKTCYWCKESIKAAALVCKYCGKNPSSPSAQAIEKVIRKELRKPTGELTKADFEKVTELDLDAYQLTDVGWLENLTRLKSLHLKVNQLTNVKGLEKLTQLTLLDFNDNGLTELPKGLDKLTQLKGLALGNNPDLTKAQIAELKKALPNCNIYSDFD